jgi:putative PIN family toxin of toxin-antitoxin system
MRVVVDTNTIISSFFYPNSIPRKAFDHARKNGTLIVTLDTFDELVSVLYRKKFDKYGVQGVRKEFIETFIKEVERVTVLEFITACKDPKDDKFLEAAIAGNADVIITGDKLLKELDPFRGIKIISPADYLDTYSV